jgi:glycosyltransferase involved in cell wall biosynthesis
MGQLSEDHTVYFITSGSGPLRDDIDDIGINLVEIESIRKGTTANRLLTRTGLKPAEIETLSALRGIFRKREFINDALDVLSTHYYLDNILLSRIVDVPTVFRFPGIKQPSLRWKAMERIARPDLYIANSRSTADRVRQWYDINIDGVVYAGVERDRFYLDRTYERSDPVTILFVGRIDDGKGLHDLLSAVAALDRIDLEVRIVGDGSLKSTLELKAESLGIADRVAFPGPVPYDAVHEEYAAADVFCLPSHHESLGLVNIEAMLSGLPVVSTTIDAIEEYITHEETGLLVDPKDVPALADALERLIESVELRRELGEGGQLEAEGYTVEASVEAMAEMYQYAIER